MRAFLVGFMGLWLSAYPALATLTTTQLHGFNAGGDASVSGMSFVGCTASTTDTDAYTFSSHDVGIAGNRDTIIAIAGRDSASVFSVSSVTVGGASATEVVDEDGTGLVNTAIYIVDNPSGTAEDIVVTFSEAITDAVICVYAAYSLSSETAVASTADDDTAAGALALSLNTSNLGVAVGICAENDSEDRAATWVGLSEDDEGLSGDLNYSAAGLYPTATEAPLTATCDWTGSGDTSGVTASFL